MDQAGSGAAALESAICCSAVLRNCSSASMSCRSFWYRSGPHPVRASFAPDHVIAAPPAAAVRRTVAVDRRSGAAVRHVSPAVPRWPRRAPSAPPFAAGAALRCLPKLFGLRARRINVMRALLHVVRALRVLLLQFAGLPLQIGDLAPQGVTRRLQFRDGSGGAAGAAGGAAVRAGGSGAGLGATPPMMVRALSDRLGHECRSPSAPANRTINAAVMANAGSRKRNMRLSSTVAWTGGVRDQPGNAMATRRTDGRWVRHDHDQLPPNGSCCNTVETSPRPIRRMSSNKVAT